MLVLVGFVAAVVVTATLVVGERTDPAPATPQHQPGDADHDLRGPQPEGAAPQLAAEQALTAMFSWQPAADATSGAALTRARAWLTGELARAASGAPASGVREPPQWSAWRRSEDVISASARADVVSDCRADQCTVTTTVTQIVLHRDGTTTPYRTLTISAFTASTEHGWRLADYRVTA